MVVKMKIGEEFICYQHQQAQDVLEKLLIVVDCDKCRSKLKEAIEWITKANDSAVRMENKLKWYKENEKISCNKSK